MATGLTLLRYCPPSRECVDDWWVSLGSGVGLQVKVKVISVLLLIALL